MQLNHWQTYTKTLFMGSVLSLCVFLFSGYGSVPKASAQLSVPYDVLSEALNQSDWIDPLFYDTDGRQPGLYLKLDRLYELKGYQRPDTSRLFVYAYWPEELYHHNIRYWVEITDVREEDQQLFIAFQSRTLPGEARACYVGQLHFKRSHSGWKLIERKLFPLD